VDSLRTGQIRKDKRGRVMLLFVIQHIGTKGAVSGTTITNMGTVEHRMFERSVVETKFPFIMWSPAE
jgi:hypothetical protein